MTPAQKVLAILGSDPVAKMKPFTFEGVRYEPASNLWDVSLYIWGGSIQVKEKTGMKAGAWYLGATDTMLIPPITNEPTTQALVIHESVHAWQDIMRLAPALSEDSEGPAYIIQMMYLSQLVASGKRLTSKNPDTDWVFEEAWGVAEMIMHGGTPGRLDYVELQTAISSIRKYLGVKDTDGVPFPMVFLYGALW